VFALPPVLQLVREVSQNFVRRNATEKDHLKKPASDGAIPYDHARNGQTMPLQTRCCFDPGERKVPANYSADCRDADRGAAEPTNGEQAQDERPNSELLGRS
jgi:hypothetical protein